MGWAQVARPRNSAMLVTISSSMAVATAPMLLETMTQRIYRPHGIVCGYKDGNKCRPFVFYSNLQIGERASPASDRTMARTEDSAPAAA